MCPSCKCYRVDAGANFYNNSCPSPHCTENILGMASSRVFSTHRWHMQRLPIRLPQHDVDYRLHTKRAASTVRVLHSNWCLRHKRIRVPLRNILRCLQEVVKTETTLHKYLLKDVHEVWTIVCLCKIMMSHNKHFTKNALLWNHNNVKLSADDYPFCRVKLIEKSPTKVIGLQESRNSLW